MKYHQIVRLQIRHASCHTEEDLCTLLASGSKICMDSTHKTDAYDYYLTTLLVVDELRKG